MSDVLIPIPVVASQSWSFIRAVTDESFPYFYDKVLHLFALECSSIVHNVS